MFSELSHFSVCVKFFLISLMAEQAKAPDLSPSVSGDDGEPNPRRRARTPPPPPRQSPKQGEALERVERSAASPIAGDGGERQDGDRRLLVYGDGSTPQGALQAAGALLRHVTPRSFPPKPNCKLQMTPRKCRGNQERTLRK